MGAEHKDMYELHPFVEKAESLLKDSGWTFVEAVPYDFESPLGRKWGEIFTKDDKIVYLNRFTAETIVNLF